MLNHLFYTILDLQKTNLKKLIFITNLILFIPFIIVINLLLTNYIHTKKQEAITMIHQELAMIDKSFASYCNDIMELTKQPYYDMSSKILDFSSPAFGGLLVPDDPQSVYSSYTDDKMVNNVFQKMLATKNRIYAILIYNTEGEGRSFLKANSMLTSYKPSQDEWFRQSIALKGTPYVSGIFKFDNIALNIGTGDYVFSISRALRDINTTKILGVVSVCSSVDVFEDFLEDTHTGERYFVLDRDGNVVYDTNPKYIGTSATDAFFDVPHLADALASSTVYSHFEDSSLFVRHSIIDGFTIVKSVPDRVLFRNTQFTNGMFLLVELLFFALTFLMTFLTAGSISRPLRHLTKTIEEMQDGDMSVRIVPGGTSEVVTLSNAFNNMLNRLDYLVNTVHINELKQKESELTLLHSQIAPHFLYNSLESIRMMAEINDDEQTAAMTLLLSKLLHYSINYRLKVVTVQEEIDYLKSYIELYNYRSPEHLTLKTDIPPQLMEFKILRLLFQPIVENSIFHGFGNNDNKCIIHIAARSSGRCVEFRISDNGAGMDEKQVARLNLAISSDEVSTASSGRSNGIGLKNIYDRLRLFFGDDCAMSVKSSPGQGTTVLLWLPMDKPLDERTANTCSAKKEGDFCNEV